MNVAAKQTYTYYDIKLMIDGKECGWGGSTLTPDGSGLVQFSVGTDDFPNGKHTLTVQDKAGNKSVRTAIFRNEIWNVNATPLFDTMPDVKDVPAVCTISATLVSAQPWTVKIQSTDNALALRTFSGKSADIHVVWNGKDATGHEVKDEPYNVVLSCEKQTITRTVNKNFRNPF